MKISTKGRYGLRIMLDLALYGANGPRAMKEISQSQQISEKYISRLIVLLHKAGLVISLRGAKGGYILAKKPEEISLLEIIEVMEGKIALVGCIDNPEFCARAESCSACMVWSGLNQNIRKQFEGITLKNLMEIKNPPSLCP